MAKTITLDNVDLAQVILMKDPSSGKILVRATYHVKAGADVVKTTADRTLTFMAGPGMPDAKSPADLMSAQEQAAASAAWDAVRAALQRLEL